MSKILYFEGAGWSGADISKATIGNCRIRTAFHLDDGRAVYLEIIGSERTKHSSSTVFKWQYTGFVDTCHYITNDVPNEDYDKHNIRMRDSKRIFKYTEVSILRLVNSLGASFDKIKVLPDLGGYRVFRGQRPCQGPDGYYYGDEFQYDSELVARREAVYQYYYALEKSEGQKYPNFSLWVDEFDPCLLHLMRHFSGYNKHWIIRVDKGNTLEDWIASTKETYLGRCGC